MDSTSTEMNMSVLTDWRAHWEKPVIFNPTWKVCHDSDTSQVMASCSFFFPFFLSSLFKGGTGLHRQPWGGLSCNSMATLHTETSLCLFFVWICKTGRILARPREFHCEISMVGLNGALMKNGDHFRPCCSFQILLLEPLFIKNKQIMNNKTVLWSGLIFMPVFMVMIHKKQPVYFPGTVLYCS